MEEEGDPGGSVVYCLHILRETDRLELSCRHFLSLFTESTRLLSSLLLRFRYYFNSFLFWPMHVSTTETR